MIRVARRTTSIDGGRPGRRARPRRVRWRRRRSDCGTRHDGSRSRYVHHHGGHHHELTADDGEHDDDCAPSHHDDDEAAAPHDDDHSSTTTTTTTPPTTTLPTPIPPPLDPESPEPVIEIGRIEIPRLALDRTMYEGIRLTTLDYGPGHWPGTAMPGNQGNVVVAGHRVSHNQDFRYLDQLVPGDEVFFTVGDQRFTYAVDQITIEDDSAVWIVDQTPAHTATLFACHPPGSVEQRIVAHLSLVA